MVFRLHFTCAAHARGVHIKFGNYTEEPLSNV